MADEKKQYPRSKLQVTEAAGDPKTFGDRGGQVLNFRAKFTGPENNPWVGQTLGLGCFRKDLFATIQSSEPGSMLDCDVETKPYQTQDGERLNYTVTQIYVDGQPVAGKGQRQGGYSNADSPEKLKSIERQVSAKLALEFAAGKGLIEALANAETIYQWISGRGTAPEAAPKPTESTKKDIKGEAAPSLKDLGELFSRAAKFGLSPQDVRAAVEVDTDDDIIDYDEAWKATATKFKGTIKAQQEAK